MSILHGYINSIRLVVLRRGLRGRLLFSSGGLSADDDDGLIYNHLKMCRVFNYGILTELRI